MTIHRVPPEDAGTLRLPSVPNSAEYRRYAEVARRLAKQQQGSDRFMWGQLVALWGKVAERKVAAEGQLLPRRETQNRPPDESDA
jgi:hypothetical protein